MLFPVRLFLRKADFPSNMRNFSFFYAEKNKSFGCKPFFVRLRLNLHFTLFSPLYLYKYTFVCIYTLFSATVIRLNTSLRKCFSAILAVFPLMNSTENTTFVL